MGKNIVFTACCLVVLAVLSVPGMAAERVVVVSDRWMPYNGEPGSFQEGYAVEILRAVFESRGFEVDYKEQPWKRAVDDVRSGKADILIGAAQSEMPAFLYPKQSLGRADLCFFSNRPDWQFTDLRSLETVMTGYVQGYGYPRWFLDEVRSNPGRFHALHGENAFSRLLRMLREGRVQVIPGNRAVAEYYIRSNRMQGEVFFAGCSEADSRELYFALSPANRSRSQLLADILDQGLTTMRNTGQLNHLLIKYGLKDWVKIR